VTSAVGVPVLPRPCSAAEAVARARRMIGNGGEYQLGTGDYRPRSISAVLVDVPWTSNGSVTGSDCAGFALSWCYKLQRHRPGYNRSSGPSASVVDDINCNSAIEDAETGGGELFAIADGLPQPGDLLCYPTIVLLGGDGETHKFIGHVCIVIGVDRLTTAWDPAHPQYEMLDVVQCKGPNGRSPGVIASDGSIWSHHDEVWPKPAHRTRVLRAVP